MQKFTGSLSYKIMCCFWLAMSLGVLYFGVSFITVKRVHDAAMMSGSALFLVMGGFVGFMALYGLLEMFVIYTVDENGLTRQGWNGRKQMYWSSIARFEANGEKDSELIFVDGLGEKLSVQRGLLGSKRVGELNALLEPYLAPLRERQRRELGILDNVYHPKRSLTWAGALMSVIVGIMLVFICSMPIKGTGDWVALLLLLLFMGSMELLFLYITVQAYTNILIVTPDRLTDKSLFRTRSIAFTAVTSMMSREVRTKSDTWEITTIESSDGKIVLSAKMKDYLLILDHIRARTGETALTTGQVAAQQFKNKEEKQRRILGPILCLILFLMFAGMGVALIRKGNERLAPFRLLDAQGCTAAGSILGRKEEDSKKSGNPVRYTFNVEGQPVQGVSSVSWNDYQRLQPGDPVTVTYLPTNREVSSIVQSVEKKKAEGSIRTGYIEIGIGVIVLPLLGLSFLRKQKTTQ